MTRAEALRAAGIAKDEVAVRAILADLSEADRADLIPVAREIVTAVKRKGIDAVGHLESMLLMAYGVLSVSDIRKLGWRSNHIPEELGDVLRRRSPERLIPIVEYLLDDFGFWAWATVRRLVLEGTVPRPDRPSYTIAMLAATRYDRFGPAELIAADPGLLEVEVWRLFEVEGGGEDSLANHEKFFGDRWGDLFRHLAARRPTMRQRVLDLSLAALGRVFSSYRAGWFSRFHESLQPTDEERAERAEAYLGLLRSRVGPTVSFAVAALGRIQGAGRLSADALLDHIGPVLVEGSGGTAKAAIGLVGRAGAGSPDDARRAASVATDALGNASPDVQKVAIALIGRLAGSHDEALARAVAGRLPEVAASQRPAAATLLARLGGDGAPVAPPSPAVSEPVATSSRRPSPIDPERAVEPLTTIEALVDVAVSVLETGEPSDDVERVLDAVGRLAGDRPVNFGRLAAAIAKRARTILARRDSSPFTGSDPRADVAAVLLAWATGELVEPAAMHRSIDPGVGAFLSARAREVGDAAAAGHAFVGVAAPTHTGGWIDPAVLVQRLHDHPPASSLDLVAALLRLAPDGRQAVLGASAGLGREVGAVVRYALGAKERIGQTAAWWVAAARVRAPGQDDPAVEKRHPHLGPDAGQAARIGLTPAIPKGWRNGLDLEIEPTPTSDTAVELPTVLMLHDPSRFSSRTHAEPALFRWMATVQPGYREPWSAVGTRLIGLNVDWGQADWANRAFLEPFVDPVTSIGPHARTLLGIALGSKDAGERGLATDVVRLALADGRLTASSLAEGLTAAATLGCDRPIRWALSLADVAAMSAGSAAAVSEAIGMSLPALAERPPATLVPFLRLFDELLAGLGRPAVAASRPVLERLGRAGGKGGLLARSILSRG